MQFLSSYNGKPEQLEVQLSLRTRFLSQRVASVATVLLLLLLLLVSIPRHAAAQDDPFVGYWATSSLSSIIEVTRCGDQLCAEIAWLWDVSVAGRKLQDEKNPQESKRKDSLLGLQLFSRFKKEGDSWKGRIYNPEDGRTYRASVTMRGENILSLKGCWGPFCQTQYWHRLRSINVPTEVDLILRRH